MDSLFNILQDKNFDDPPEAVSIKQYARDLFREDVRVQVTDREIVITAPSAAMANTLRLHTVDIQNRVGTDRRLVFRIGK